MRFKLNPRITRLTCDTCGHFIGLVRYEVEFPESDKKCCQAMIETARALAEPRRRTAVKEDGHCMNRNVGNHPANGMDEGHYQGYGGWDDGVKAFENRND